MPDFIRSRFASYTTTGKTWLTLGILALIVDAAICYRYGITITFWHAAGYALVAVFFAWLPDAAYNEIENKRIASGIVLGLACIPLGCIAFQSHLGYSSAVRLGDMQQTGVQNTKYADKVDDTKKLNEKIAFLEKRRDALDAEMASLVNTKVGTWSVAVRPSSASELDGAIAAKELEVANESKRGGCKRECEKRTNELAHLTALRAKAKEIETNEEQHAAAVAGLASAREKVAETTYQSSAVVNQNNVVAQLFLAFSGADPEKAIDPDQVTTSFTSIVLAGGGSLAFMLMAPLGFFVAGRNRRPEAVAEPVETAAPARVELRSEAKGNDLSRAGDVHYHVTDNRDVWELLASLKTNRAAPQLAAA